MQCDEAHLEPLASHWFRAAVGDRRLVSAEVEEALRKDSAQRKQAKAASAAAERLVRRASEAERQLRESEAGFRACVEQLRGEVRRVREERQACAREATALAAHLAEAEPGHVAAEAARGRAFREAREARQMFQHLALQNERLLDQIARRGGAAAGRSAAEGRSGGRDVTAAAPRAMRAPVAPAAVHDGGRGEVGSPPTTRDVSSPMPGYRPRPTLGEIRSALSEKQKKEHGQELLIRRIRQEMGMSYHRTKRLFQTFDVDGSGEIEFDEFREMLARLRVGADEDAVAQMFSLLDTDGSGSVDMEEYLNLIYPEETGPKQGERAEERFSFKYFLSKRWTEQSQELMKRRIRQELGMSLQRATRLFQTFDADANGGLDEEEFKHMMRSLKIGFNDHAMEQMFHILDGDVSGAVDVGEYLRFIFPDMDHEGEGGASPAAAATFTGAGASPAQIDEGDTKGATKERLLAVARRGSGGLFIPNGQTMLECPSCKATFPDEDTWADHAWRCGWVKGLPASTCKQIGFGSGNG